MPRFLKTVRGACKFFQQLALECTKLIKVGIFLELDKLDSYPVLFGMCNPKPGYLHARLRSLYIVRGICIIAEIR